jgi:hypothetical protein
MRCMREIRIAANKKARRAWMLRQNGLLLRQIAEDMNVQTAEGAREHAIG